VRELCLSIGDKAQLFWVQRGLWEVSLIHELHAAEMIEEQLMDLAKDLQDPDMLLEANCAAGHTQAFPGDFGSASRTL
jgi:hypothetical protein